MDADVQTALITMLTAFKDSALDTFGLVIPIVGAFIITVGVASFIIKWFMSHSR